MGKLEGCVSGSNERLAKPRRPQKSSVGSNPTPSAYMPHAIFDGQLTDESEAKISIADKGYFFDFAVYSSVKVLQGKIFFPEHHAARLLESAGLLGLEHNFQQEDVVRSMKELVVADQIQDALLRIVLIGDPDNQGGEKLFIFSVGGLTFYPDKLYKEGAKAITFLGERRIPQAKTKDLLMSFIAYRKAKELGALDALLVDPAGNIREGTRSNIFAIKGRVLYTPPSDTVLGGIVRKIILEVAHKDFEIKETDIALADIKNYEEVFISSTSMNVMPIKQIDDIVFDTDFPKTHEVAKLVKEYYNKEVWT